MRRALALLALLVALPLVAACSDSSNSSSESQTPYAGGPSNQPTASTGPALTQADIDKYVAISLDFAVSPKNADGQKAVLEKNGTTMQEWFSLYTRVKEARMAIVRNEKRNEPIPANLAGDVELIKANKDKIEKALSGKP